MRREESVVSVEQGRRVYEEVGSDRGRTEAAGSLSSVQVNAKSSAGRSGTWQPEAHAGRPPHHRLRAAITQRIAFGLARRAAGPLTTFDAPWSVWLEAENDNLL